MSAHQTWFGPIDRHIPRKIGINPMLGMRRAGPGRLMDRLQAHQPHQPPHPVPADRMAFPAELAGHLTRAVKRVLQIELVDPAHQRQALRALALGPVIQRGTADRQDRALPAQTQRRIVAPDHRPARRPAHRLSPRAKKSRSTVSLADLGVQVVDLDLPIRARLLRAIGKHRVQAIHRLALPDTHLVRMHLVPTRGLLDRPIAPKRLKRHLRLEIRHEPTSRPHIVSLPHQGEYTLADCPIS